MTRSPASYPPRLPDEERRLQSLRGYHVLDTPAEGAFDDLVKLAASLLGMPMALVTLIDEDRQWIKAKVGLDLSETARQDSFCAHAIAKPDLMVVEDTAEDERFRENPFVLDDPNIRFYAGAPLVTPEGQGVGALCVLDRVPHRLTDEQEETLRVLGRQVMMQLELRRMVRRSQHERDDLLNILHALPAAVIIANAPNAEVMFQNEAVRTLLGVDAANPSRIRQFWRATQVKSRSGEILPVSDWPAMRALGGETIVGEELRLELPGGRTLPILIGAAPIRDDEDRITGAVIGFQDVSSLHELSRLKNDFVSTVSHELRTPLTSIRGSLQLLLSEDDAVPSGQRRQLLSIALTNTDRLIRMITDILDIAKIEAGQMGLARHPAEVAPIVRTAVEAVHGFAEARGIAVRQTIAPALPLIDADHDRLAQAIVNLLSNAIKFSREGGEVHVDVSLADGSVALKVTDTGRGIPEGDLALVFEKFHQAGGANRQGTGLGLSITKALVEQHGGSISVASAEGAGTTFTITLPASRG